MNIVLFEPRIPQNTGNIARTCAVTGSTLHLIKPYAFQINEKNIKRAGLTYWNILKLKEYESFEEFMSINSSSRIFLVTSKSNQIYSSVRYLNDDFFIFGREDTGVTSVIHEKLLNNSITIPMVKNPEARCLNLATSVGIILFEAMRQNNYNSLI